MEFLQPGVEKDLQAPWFFLAPVVVLGQLQADQPARGQQLALQLPGNGAVDSEGLAQGLLHLAVPGVIHPAGDQLPGHEKQKQGGHQSQADKGQNQPGAQPGAEDLAPPLQKQLGQLAENQKGEEQQDKGVEVEEAEGQQAAGHRLPPPVHQEDFQGGDGHHQHQGDADKGAFPAPFSLFRGRSLRGVGALTQH